MAVLQKPEVSERLVNNSRSSSKVSVWTLTQIFRDVLQVQDITSQQLAAVNSLLQTVQNKLGEIMVHFRNTEIGELITASTRRPIQEETHAAQVSSLHRAIAYDSDVGSALSGDQIVKMM